MPSFENRRPIFVTNRIVRNIVSGTAIGVFIGLCFSFVSPFLNVLWVSRADDIAFTIRSDVLFYNFIFPYHLASGLFIGFAVGLLTTCICMLTVRVPHSLLTIPITAILCGAICAFIFTQDSIVNRVSFEIFGNVYPLNYAFFVAFGVSLHVALWFYSRLLNTIRSADNAMDAESPS